MCSGVMGISSGGVCVRVVWCGYMWCENVKFGVCVITCGTFAVWVCEMLIVYGVVYSVRI